MAPLARFRTKKSEAPRPDVASILHLDMDAFFVSVELLDRSELRGKPVIVGGRPGQRGVVSAASYEARKFGIHSAMPLRTAGRLCPHAVFLDGDHKKYSFWSDRIARLLSQYSPIVEMISIDEAYLDLSGTHRLHGPPLAAAHSLLMEITSKTGLPCSGGLATTRLVAKVASDQAKPRGLLWIPAGGEESFLAPLLVRKIPGIGEITERALCALGIQTVGQLAALPGEKLVSIFGQWGVALHRKSRGGDAWDFVIDAEPRSISHNHTFGEDIADTQALEAMLSHLSQKACLRLRQAGLVASTLTLTIRYAGFETHTRSRTLSAPVQFDPDILPVFLELFRKNRAPKRKIRLLGVALGNFSHFPAQLDFLEADRREKLQKLTGAADRLRNRFGFDSIRFGGSLPRPQG